MSVVIKVVAEAINELDPIGLLSDGAPGDEYRTEIKEIANRLRMINTNISNEDELAKMMYEVFVEYFDEDLAGSFEKYKGAARRIFDKLSKGYRWY